MAAVTAAVAAAGIGMSIYGSVQQSKAAKQQAAAQQQMIAAEKEAEEARRRQMELDARRKSMEVIRNQQRARSLALAAASNQGALLGSGLQGGYAQIAGQTGVNIAGIQQNLALGRDIFSANEDLSNAKMAYARYGSDLATARGWSSIGGTLVSNAGTIGNLMGGFGTPSTTRTGNTNPFGYYGTQVGLMGSSGIY